MFERIQCRTGGEHPAMEKVDRRCTGSHVGNIEIDRRFGRLLGGRTVARPRNDLKGTESNTLSNRRPEGRDPRGHLIEPLKDNRFAFYRET